MPKVAIIIVVFNGEEYLPDLLASLNKQTYPKEQIRIIAVDNASQDSSVKLISEWPGVRVIRNMVNRGFAGANNQGIRLALEENADYIFLLNQDTVCQPDVVEKLVQALEENKEVGIIQPLLLLWPEKDRVQTSGDRIHFLGFGYSGDYRRPLSITPHLQANIPYASGAAMFIRAKALKEVGLLDKDLFMYHEDLDLCLRARFLGHQIKLVSQAIVYHKYTPGIPAHRWYWSERNRLITLLKFYKLPTLVLIFLPWLFMEIGVFVYSLLTGWGWLKIKSYFSFFWQLPKTLWKRRKIQRTRKISERDLAGYLEGRFDFRGLEHPLLKYLVNPIFSLSWYFLRKLIIW